MHHTETRKIIIVEDDPYTQDLLGTAFRALNFDVTILPDADEPFLETVREKRPDIISMDVMIGKNGAAANRDGFAALTLLRETEDTKDIPVMIVSNFSEESHVARAKELGASDYFIGSAYKPSSIAKQFLIYLSDPEGYEPVHPLCKE
ncbi:response regulator [Candidatus Kaiserbacteria bacterium]|nr:response regulator [Candidatus Kaiserbacteria bacterium]